MTLPDPQGAVRVENVIACPPGTRTPTLRGVTFTLKPGDVLGVIGPSAAGKSTLARALVGVWPAISGAVRLDGADAVLIHRVLDPGEEPLEIGERVEVVVRPEGERVGSILDIQGFRTTSA